MDPWSNIGAKVLSGDVNYAKIVAAKKALKLLADNKDVVVKICLACADNDLFEVKEAASSDSSVINKADSRGITPLVYAICFKQKECVELLLALGADANLEETCIGWTPMMWATNFDYKDIVESLVGAGADPLKRETKKENGKNAIDLAKDGSACFEYYKTHGYMKKTSNLKEDDDTFYKNDTLLPQETDEEAAFKAQMKLQALNLERGDDDTSSGLSLRKIDSAGSHKFVDDSETDILAESTMAWDQFEFNAITERQYIKLVDDSVPDTIDYIFSLYTKYPSKPLYPATVMFMCLRYAESKLNNPETTLSLLELFTTRIRTETGTKSGVLQYWVGSKKDNKKKKESSMQTRPDIVVIGFWIGVLNHLMYFLHRDISGLLRKHPHVWQMIVSTLHPLVVQLAYILDDRLEDLIDKCLLEYTSVPDMDIVYRNEWRLFKKKKPSKKTTYKEIIDMLYPPTLDQQRKPSPLKIIQTLGALLYVMELFHINDEIALQCFTHVLFWISSTIFNRVIANKKYCSRAQGLQLRLNISYIQDWLRSNNFTPHKTSDVDFKNSKYPDDQITVNDQDANTADSAIFVQGVARFHGNKQNAKDGTFYFNSLYKVGELLLSPVIELVEWLQVMTRLKDEASLKDVIENFKKLDTAQLLQAAKNYKYEVDEEQFPKKLTKWLKKYPSDAADKDLLHYSSDSKGLSSIFFNVGEAFPLALPGYLQLLHQYGMDIDAIDNTKMRRYQPNIPVEVQDDLDNIMDKYGCLEESGDATGETGALNTNSPNGQTEAGVTKNAFEGASRDANLFEVIKAPNSIAHKTWAVESDRENNDNPWA